MNNDKKGSVQEFFRFYRGYAQASRQMKPKPRGELLCAVIDYMFYGEEPSFKSGSTAAAVWELLKKNLDKSMSGSRSKSALELMSDIFDYIRATELPSTSIQAGDVSHITGDADISMVAVRKIIDLYPLYDKFLMERGLYNYSDVLPLFVFNGAWRVWDWRSRWSVHSSWRRNENRL